MFKNKIKTIKGELTTQQIVILIILIVSFVIILFLIFRLNLGETSAKEICHNSVIMKGKSILGADLNCETNYICISGGQECENFPSSKISVNSNNKNEVMKAIADEMADCWWMFGEGKIDYGGGFTEYENQYALCSIIKFDKTIQEKFPQITYAELYDFLEKNKKDETQTYLRYLYEINSLAFFEQQPQFNVNINTNVISTTERYSIITGIDKNIVDVVDDDEIFNVYIIPTSEISSRLEQGEFVTKA